MDLKDILAISGKPGLFKHLSKSKNGVIVESLIDQKRMHAFASDKISALQDIAIYTEGEDMPLIDVLKRIFEKENGGASINHKSSGEELKKYFAEALPEYDKDRVYVSDIKRVINWYNILQKLGLVDLEEDKDEEKPEEKKEEKQVENKKEEEETSKD